MPLLPVIWKNDAQSGAFLLPFLSENVAQSGAFLLPFFGRIRGNEARSISRLQERMLIMRRVLYLRLWENWGV